MAPADPADEREGRPEGGEGPGAPAGAQDRERFSPGNSEQERLEKRRAAILADLDGLGPLPSGV